MFQEQDLSSEQLSGLLRRQFLILPATFFCLLIVVGAMGIFVSSQSAHQLEKLHRSAVEPSLAIHEIRGQLTDITRQFDNLGSADEHENAARVSVLLRDMERVEPALSAQLEKCRGRSYELFLVDWAASWKRFLLRAKAKLSGHDNVRRSSQELKAEVIAFGDRMENVSQFIASDVQEQMESSTSFSTHWTTGLSLILAVGLLFIIGFTSFMLIRLGAQENQIRESNRMIQDQQRALVSSSKMSALGEMAGGIAHEINNPLAIIRTQASVAEDILLTLTPSPDIEALATRLKKIQSTTDRIAKIVRGLRAFSRSGEDTPFAEIRSTDLVGDTRSFCAERIRHGEVKIVEEIEEFFFDGQYTQLSQVLLNLLNNAYDAVCDKKGSWIKVSISLVSGWVQLRVEDSGAIPFEVRRKIFQPFFTTKEIGKGTGMGLAISLGIVKDHGGSLTLDEALPNTCFLIRFPQRQISRERKTAA
jgi:C4-dicarboxylate-specific signal transduction histidine kinase